MLFYQLQLHFLEPIPLQSHCRLKIMRHGQSPGERRVGLRQLLANLVSLQNPTPDQLGILRDHDQ